MSRKNGSWIIGTFTILTVCFAMYVAAKLFMKLTTPSEKKSNKPINGNKVDSINEKEPFIV